MTDNIKVAPSATGKDIAADSISDVLHQRVKVQYGDDGSATDVSATNPLPVTVAAGTNNIGDVDVLTVPAPLSTTGGGTEATALRVTVANDSTGVVSVDDNGGSLTVDGAVTANTGATDDAAAAGQIYPMAGVYQATVDEVDDGDIGRARITPRRAVIQAVDYRLLALTSAAPTPSGTDITNAAGTAIIAGDLEIRDTNTHVFVIPLAHAGWRHIQIGILNTATWDQTITILVQSRFGLTGASALDTLGTWANSVTNQVSHVISNSGAVGLGGLVGASPAALYRHYSIPAMSGVSAIRLALSASVAPTTGNISMYIVRST